VFERLADQLEIAQEYAGTIFASARVTGAASYWRNEDPDRDRERHWRSNIYATIDRPHVFARPLPDAVFRSHVTISPGGAITPLHGQSFETIKELLLAKNRLPHYLMDARPGGISFRDVNPSTWLEIACSSEARFIDESQLRAYLLNFLLEELKDPRTPVYEECRCARDGQHPSFADYFVRVNGRWMPVEAKLNVRAERDLAGQIAKYVGLNEFVPTRGTHAGKVIEASVGSTCLVADAEGLYLVTPTGYLGCGPDEPHLRRAEITRDTIKRLRRRLSQASI
jgi:hypothetical protein